MVLFSKKYYLVFQDMDAQRHCKIIPLAYKCSSLIFTIRIYNYNIHYYN